MYAEGAPAWRCKNQDLWPAQPLFKMIGTIMRKTQTAFSSASTSGRVSRKIISYSSTISLLLIVGAFTAGCANEGWQTGSTGKAYDGAMKSPEPMKDKMAKGNKAY